MGPDDAVEGHVARPSGLRTVLHSAAQLPFNVAAGLADEVTFQTGGIASVERHADAETDSRQLYHESNAEMREADTAELHVDKVGRQKPQDEVVDSFAAIDQDAEQVPSAHEHAQSHPEAISDKATGHRISPKKSVTIKENVNVIGEDKHEPAPGHLLASKSADPDSSTSTSSSVSSLLTLHTTSMCLHAIGCRFK